MLEVYFATVYGENGKEKYEGIFPTLSKAMTYLVANGYTQEGEIFIEDKDFDQWISESKECYIDLVSEGQNIAAV